MESFLFAILLATIAGLSTTVGSVIVLFFRNPGPKFLTIALSFSAGVMILVSFVELLQEGIEAFGIMWGLLLFLFGMVLMMGIDKFVSHRYEFEGDCLAEQGTCPLLPEENPSSNPGSNPGQTLEQIEVVQEPMQFGHRGRGRRRDHHRQRKGHMRHKHLEKTSLLVAIGIFIHNFPEGIATLAGTLKDMQLGILLATAIAIHNIPEGIIVAAPVCAASGKPKKAILWSFLSGVSEPLGAILAGLILLPFINDLLIAGMLAVVAGIMVFISLDELLPMCQRYRYEHLSILGLILGFLVMGISLALI